MANPFFIAPTFDKPSATYRQKLAWKITEEDWNRPSNLVLKLSTKIPGTLGRHGGNIIFMKIGGSASREVHLETRWPNDAEVDKIHIEAIFSVKANDDDKSFVIGGGWGNKKLLFKPFVPKPPNGQYQVIVSQRKVLIDPTNLADPGSSSFIFEAELFIDTSDINQEDQFKKPNTFVKDMETILHDDENSDIVIVVDNVKFKCHKTILSARSPVFKNMLAPHTLESQTNTINVQKVPAEAVKEMIKHIYTGEIPSDPEILSVDLLQLADMYQLVSLKDACVENLLSSLDVPTCISTFLVMDHYFPLDEKVRERLAMFMNCKAEEVIETDGWKRLMGSHPSLVTELTRAMLRGRKAKEKHKCQFCVVSYM